MTTIPSDQAVASRFFPCSYRESLSEFFVPTGFRVVASKQVFTCRMTLKEFQSKGGKAHRGTQYAKDRARRAAQARWTKYRSDKKQAKKETK